MKVCILIMAATAILGSCTNLENDKKEPVFTSYSIWGEEGKEFVTCFFQFRSGNPDGPAVVLKEPDKVMVDSILLVADSAGENGTFYETQIPLEKFAGEHTIHFIKGDKDYKETFSFTPFKLINEIGDALKREDILLQMQGLENKTVLRVVIADTVFNSEGINEIDTVKNNQLDLRGLLGGIKNGPITLQLFKEDEKPLKDIPGEGKISITYSLKREFELKD